MTRSGRTTPWGRGMASAYLHRRIALLTQYVAVCWGTGSVDVYIDASGRQAFQYYFELTNPTPAQLVVTGTITRYASLAIPGDIKSYPCMEKAYKPLGA